MWKQKKLKNCIIAVLLGFDEVHVFQNRYSSPFAIRKDYYFPGTHKWLQQPGATTHIESDIVTVFTLPKFKKRIGRDAQSLPKYETCIAISLFEPLVEYDDAHHDAFKFVNQFLKRNIPNWWEELKIILRHHSVPQGNHVSFDARLMQNKFVPGTYEQGFQERKVFDFRKELISDRQTTQPLSFEEAQKLSREISKRIHTHHVTLDRLALWIGMMLPLPPRPWSRENPLKITMGGCHAGQKGIRNSLIENFAYSLIFMFLTKSIPQNKHYIEIIGAITWTFYNNWRVISAFETYLEPERNPDPFRGLATDKEKNFFVQALDTMRRSMTRMVCIIPSDDQTYVCEYKVRPVKNSTDEHNAILDFSVEKSKIDFSNAIMQSFLNIVEKTDIRRVPQRIAEIIQILGMHIFSAFSKQEFQNAEKLCSDLITNLQSQPQYNQFPLIDFLQELQKILPEPIAVVESEKKTSIHASDYQSVSQWVDFLSPEERLKYQQLLQMAQFETAEGEHALAQLRFAMASWKIDESDNTPFEDLFT